MSQYKIDDVLLTSLCIDFVDLDKEDFYAAVELMFSEGDTPSVFLKPALDCLLEIARKDSYDVAEEAERLYRSIDGTEHWVGHCLKEALEAGEGV